MDTHPDDRRDVIAAFEDLFHKEYTQEIEALVDEYSLDNKSLVVDYGVVNEYDAELAAGLQESPSQMLEYAETALAAFHIADHTTVADRLPGSLHVRVRGLPSPTPLSGITAAHLGQLCRFDGIISEISGVQKTMTTATYECQRCGMVTRIPQDGDLQEPQRCQACERDGPFRINQAKSEFTDQQTIELSGIDRSADGVLTPTGNAIEVTFADDYARRPTAGGVVSVTGIVEFIEMDSPSDEPIYEPLCNGLSIVHRDEHLQTEISRETAETTATGSTDLETYADQATAVLATLPEQAREEETKAKLITPFVTALGWNKFDSREVRLEYTDPKTQQRPDYALFGTESENPDIIIEAKQIGTKLENKQGQLYDYLRVFAASWGVLTDGETFRIYRNDQDKNETDTQRPVHVATVSVADIAHADVTAELRKEVWSTDTIDRQTVDEQTSKSETE